MSFIIMKIKAVITSRVCMRKIKSFCCCTLRKISKGSFWFEQYIHFYIKPIPFTAVIFTWGNSKFYFSRLLSHVMAPVGKKLLAQDLPGFISKAGGRELGGTEWTCLSLPTVCASRSCNVVSLPGWIAEPWQAGEQILYSVKPMKQCRGMRERGYKKIMTFPRLFLSQERQQCTNIQAKNPCSSSPLNRTPPAGIKVWGFSLHFLKATLNHTNNGQFFQDSVAFN